MTGIPSVTVKLDDGTGAYPYDVTTAARLPDTLQWSRGRGDEHSDNQPGAVAITFDNSDGAFTAERVNLQPNPSFEVGSTLGAGGNLGTTTAWSFDATRFLSGVKSLKIAPPPAGVGSLGAILDEASLGVADGLTFTLSAFLFRSAGAGTFNIGIEWRDATHVTIGATVNVAVAAAAAWGRVSLSAVAPVGARFARARVFFTTYVAGTDVVNVDKVQFVQAATPVWETFNDQGIRLIVAGNTRWTGKVQNWPVSWPNGDDTFAVSAITATDVLAALARTTLNSSTTHEILADSPSGYWPMDEESELATQARDISGNSQPPLATVAGGTVVTFGQDLGTPDGAKGVQFASSDVGLTNGFLAPKTPPNYTGSGLHVEITFTLSGTLPAGSGSFIRLWTIIEGGGTGAQLTLGELGSLNVFRGAGDVAYNVALPSYVGTHTLALDTDSTGTHIWFDNQLIDSRAGFAHSYTLAEGLHVAERFFAPSANARTCVVGQLVIGPKLGDSRTSAHQNAALFDMAGETPAARIARILSYTTAIAGSLDAAGDTHLGPSLQAGRSPLDVLADTATSDLGSLFGDANGNVSYVSGATIAGRTVPATFDAAWIDPDTQVLVDMFGVVNYATSTLAAGGNQFGPFVDAASRLAHGDYPQSYAWNVNTDQQAIDRTQWTVANYANPQPRVAQLVLDLLTMDAPTLAAALTLDLTSFLRATGMPSQTPGGTTLDVLVESITETIQAGGTDPVWSLTFNVSMQSTRSAWVLGDPNYGVLGVTTKLYV